jgi:GT2 family glycosyltransferase
VNAVSIVIPTWNGAALLKQFLPSVIAAARHYSDLSGAAVEIIIVDDKSSDDSIEWLSSNGFGEGETAKGSSSPEFRLLRNEKNVGFGRACNRAFAEARYDLVLLLNNDVEVDPMAIAPLVRHFSDQRVFAVHCRVFEFDSRKQCGAGQKGSFARGFIRVHEGYSVEGDGQGPFYSIFASGGSAVFDRSKFLELGGFEQLLSPAYWEDVEISYRAWKRGMVVLYEPQSVVRHRVSSTMRKLNRRKIRRLQQRNRLIFHWINLHDRAFLFSHLLWVCALAITAPLRLQPGFIISLLAALRRLPAIASRRRREREASKISDRELFEVFARIDQR